MSRARKPRLSWIRSGAASPPRELSATEALLERARRLRRRGDARRALVVLRQAAAIDDWNARAHTLLGAMLAELGSIEEATRAFTRARWLRARAGETGRARATERLLAALSVAAA